MVFDRCMSCLNLESQPSMGPAAKDQTLGHFLANIHARGVRNGAFELHFDGKKLDQVTLNVNHAETISAPASHFVDNEYSEILDHVASKEVTFDLPRNVGLVLPFYLQNDVEPRHPPVFCFLLRWDQRFLGPTCASMAETSQQRLLVFQSPSQLPTLQVDPRLRCSHRQ